MNYRYKYIYNIYIYIYKYHKPKLLGLFAPTERTFVLGPHIVKIQSPERPGPAGPRPGSWKDWEDLWVSVFDGNPVKFDFSGMIL